MTGSCPSARIERWTAVRCGSMPEMRELMKIFMDHAWVGNALDMGPSERTSNAFISSPSCMLQVSNLEPLRNMRAGMSSMVLWPCARSALRVFSGPSLQTVFQCHGVGLFQVGLQHALDLFVLCDHRRFVPIG